ncbi:Cyclic nucleotide-binding domain [Rubrobacter radiotolerans]|uniref:Cyclic nucleotide-binding domain n=1 Tax=Rubrobacter radiotolerans TaxID=42256 RepID=A0A023WZ25_RUBRA|nr:cyclic nucleotide-binding domain-containing protein [Rubrobacter radiotolerans]AHY45472.1 Cyclic nucleotide-binding domain [Rubrobacter radiotolerans]MDX5892883.1 cyclic nucleotide-binding domain-containing protein [Rubrobacter radiotolerans]SMC02676.1 Cyclic nucleotide-binding domain-containing protein [Rubrobacter radiotolerans DSM 5868]
MAERADVIEKLSRTELFGGLSEEELLEFCENAQTVEFAAGEELIREGREPGYMFVVTRGSVEVVKKVRRGERVLATLAATDRPTVVGERGLLLASDSAEGASATVRAASRVEAVRLSRKRFKEMVRAESPAAFKVSYRISKTLARRLVSLDEEVVAAIRELESRGEVDLEAFRDRLVTDWMR